VPSAGVERCIGGEPGAYSCLWCRAGAPGNPVSEPAGEKGGKTGKGGVAAWPWRLCHRWDSSGFTAFTAFFPGQSGE
jgi:hypothetical protein